MSQGKVPGTSTERFAPPSCLTGSIGFLLGKAAERAIRIFETALEPLGIKSKHYGVLALLEADGPSSQQAIGDRLRIDRTTMVAVMDNLEQQGLVERRTNPADRRYYEVRITKKGSQILGEAAQALAVSNQLITSNLLTEEREKLHDLLLRLCGWDS